jgi:hypothetical protein
MTENEENVNVGGIYSKFWRITLVIISVLLIFVGPSYVPYVMTELKISFFASIGAGFILFIIGILFMLFLVRKKIITT